MIPLGLVGGSDTNCDTYSRNLILAALERTGLALHQANVAAWPWRMADRQTSQ